MREEVNADEGICDVGITDVCVKSWPSPRLSLRGNRL
jgi:hypothetical protein